MTDQTTTLGDLYQQINEINIDEVSEGTLTDVARRLDLCHRMTTQLKLIIDVLTEDVASRMEDDTTSITGVGVLQRKPKTSSTWIDDTSKERMMDDAIHAIIRRVAVDPASGEVHPPLANVAREVWRLTQDSFSFTADPKTAFRKVLGLAPDEYRAKRVTGYSVAITEGEINVSEQ